MCDEVPLPSYSPVITDRTASSWIASEIGREFTIRVNQKHSGGFLRPHYTIRTEIDGKEVDYTCSGPDEYIVRGMRPTPTTFAALRFAALVTTDEGSIDEHPSVDIGTIRVKVSRVVATGLGELCSAIRVTPSAAIVHERTKKHILGGHSVTSGPVVNIPPVNTVKIEPWGSRDPEPYVVFEFKCYSRESLEAQGIAQHQHVSPPPPLSMHSSVAGRASPATSVSRKRPRRSSDQEAALACAGDDQQRANKIRKLKAELAILEAEHVDAVGGSSSLRRKPVPLCPSGGIIDLTIDDDDDDMSPSSQQLVKVKREHPKAESCMRLDDEDRAGVQ